MNGLENKKQLPLVAVCGNKKKDGEAQEKKHQSEKQRIVYSEVIKKKKGAGK